MSIDSKIEFAKKLKALSDRGVGGEKINADAMLTAFLKKHGLTIQDIEDEKKSDYFFKLKKGQSDLWAQIVHCVNKDIKAYDVPAAKAKEFKLKSRTFITCTAQEYFIIDSMLSFYWPIYEKELRVFWRAFCVANDLLVKSNKTTDDLSKDELEEYLRASKMAKSVRSESFRKQIEQGKKN